MNKCHSNLNWLNHTTPAINDTNLNYMDGCIDTVDDRIIALDTSKLGASDVSSVIKNVSLNETTGVLTFTRYNDTTFTVDTKLEKVVTNWSYDSTTQSLVLTLADGSTVSVPLSDFITETEFQDSANIAFTVENHKVKATIVGNSITDAQMQTGYLTDCQSAKNSASLAATTANDKRLVAEGYAVGTQDGVDVSEGSPYYHNNAKYYSDRTSGQSLSALNDVSIVSATDGQSLVYDATNSKWVNGEGGKGNLSEMGDVALLEVTNGQSLVYDADSQKWVNGDSAPTINVIDNLTSTSSTDALSANMGKTLDEKVQNVADDVAEIRKGWEFIGSVVNSYVRADTSKYSEFYVRYEYAETSNSDIGADFILLSKDVANSRKKKYRKGWYDNSSNYGYCQIYSENSNINTSGFIVNGTNVQTSATMTVYGRR